MAARKLKTADTTPAQAGRGDRNVLAHPAFREIPACLFPLKTQEAQAQYDVTARTLFDAGMFSSNRRMALSSYAMMFDQVTILARDGSSVSASYFTQMDKARRELNLDEIDKAIAAPASAPVNKFARAGFSSRRRWEVPPRQD